MNKRNKGNIVCNKCQKTINIKLRYKTVGNIEYNYFICKGCGEPYVISVTDEALRQNVKRYQEIIKRARKEKVTENEQNELRELLKANVARSNELKEQYPFKQINSSH